MKKNLLLIIALAGIATGFKAQSWTPTSQKSSQIRENVEVKFAYNFNISTLNDLLKDAEETGKDAKAVIVNLPTAEGKVEKFAVYSNPVLEKSMAERYGLGSYVGVGVDDPSKYVRFSTSPTEMQSMIIKDGVFQFIEPISNDKKTYGVFYKTKKTEGAHGFECSSEENEFGDIKNLEKNGKKNLSHLGITNRPASTKYRTYRLAVSVTGEYTTYFGGVAAAAAQINTTMTRVNGVFEKDFAIKLLVQDIPALIYTDANTDPYSAAASMSNWNLQLQQTLTSVVGNANYDIGHLFGASGGGGNAGCIGCICVNPSTAVPRGKGSGFTSPANGVPSGDLFDIDYVAHEMGHQLGGNHTFSHASEGSGVNVEPGGGTTIMGYAGITQDNVQNNSDAYFHYASINQILNNLDSKSTCGVSTNITNNTAPVISPLTAYSIPKGTAYYLDATATDAQGDTLKYTWEQYDTADNAHSISGDTGWGYSSQGSLARSFFGTSNGRRYFPSLNLVMDGKLTNKATWESVSYIPRTLNYAVTVRDENAQRPMLVSAETTVTVTNDGPFALRGLTTNSVLYNNASNTILWDVANTNTAPYNVSNVKIDYTTNNGATWTDLVASTPNSGSYTAQLPSGLTGPIKLRVSAIGNIFYAVSPAVNVGSAPTSTTVPPTGLSTIASDITKTTARVSWNSVPGATYSINYRKVGATNWSNTTSTVNSVNLNALEDETNYEVQVAAVVNSVPSAFSSNYTFKTNGLKTGIDYCMMSTGGNNSNGSFISGLYSFTLSNLSYSAGNLANALKTYLDYSEDATKQINLVKGSQYTFTYRNLANSAATNAAPTVSTYSDWIDVWIDYNRNGVFEASEKVVSNSAYPTASGAWFYHTGSASFTVPSTAYAGDKTLRMRVATSFFNSLNDPCGYPWVPSVSSGSFRDFNVKISEALGVHDTTSVVNNDLSIFPNPADTFVEIKNLKGTADYKIYTADGRLVLNGKTESRINVANLVKGVYVISVVNGDKTLSTKLIKK